jgi:hypothetical protein
MEDCVKSYPEGKVRAAFAPPRRAGLPPQQTGAARPGKPAVCSGRATAPTTTCATFVPLRAGATPRGSGNAGPLSVRPDEVPRWSRDPTKQTGPEVTLGAGRGRTEMQPPVRRPASTVRLCPGQPLAKQQTPPPTDPAGASVQGISTLPPSGVEPHALAGDPDPPRLDASSRAS